MLCWGKLKSDSGYRPAKPGQSMKQAPQGDAEEYGNTHVF